MGIHANLGVIVALVFLLGIRAASANQPEASARGGVSGTLRMFDHKPHVAVPVQAIDMSGRIVATVFSDEIGEYRFESLPSGPIQIRCAILGGYEYYVARNESLFVSAGEHGQIGRRISDFPSLEVRSDQILEKIDFRIGAFKRGNWKRFTTLDGLPSQNVWAGLVMEPNGLVWIGSNGGPARFDGRRFEVFSFEHGLTSIFVTALNRFEDGNLWVATQGGGLSRFDGKRFHTVQLPLGQQTNVVNRIERDSSGDLWLSSPDYLWRFNPTPGTPPGEALLEVKPAEGLPPNWLKTIHYAADETLWIGTAQGAYRYDGQHFAHFGAEHGLPGDVVQCFGESPDGSIWLGTVNGLSRFDGESFVSFTTLDGLLDNSVQAIYVAANGIAWIGTAAGVSRFDGKTFVNFTKEDGLPHSSIATISGGPDGSIWISTTLGGGLSRYDEETFWNFSMKDGLPGTWVTSMERDQGGTAWFGSGFHTTGGTLTHYDGHHLHDRGRELKLPHDWFTTIRRDLDGTLWIGTKNHGLFRLDAGGIANHIPHPSKAIFGLEIDRDGSIWFGTAGPSVFRYDGIRFNEFTTAHGLPNLWCRSIHRASDGVLWLGMGSFGNASGAIVRYDGNVFSNVTTERGLPNDAIPHIDSSTNGVVWFATTAGGVLRFENDSFTRYTTADGLAHNQVWSVHVGTDGSVWCGTYAGVSRFDGTAWSTLDTRDGLVSNAAIAILEAEDGSMWFATDGGVSRYRPNAVPPYVRVSEVRADQVFTDLSALPAFTAGARVTIKYDSIDLKTVPEKRQFRCRIVEASDPLVRAAGNNDHGWSRPSKEREFDWTPLNPGVYTFAVQAIDRDLNYSEPALLTLTVVPPFYRDTRVVVPVVLGLAGWVGYSLVFTRRYLQKGREAQRLRERARIARNMHDHLGSGVTHVAMLGEFVRQKLGQPAEAKLLAGRLVQSARDLARTMDEVVWTTDPAKDTLRSFASYITKYAENFLAGSPMRLRLDFPRAIPDLFLRSELRHNLFMVVKEALNNSVKHAHGSEVKIRLELANRTLCLVVEDDGRGFTGEQLPLECNGLSNMKSRLRDVGGELRIDSVLGRGTRIEAKVPLTGE